MTRHFPNNNNNEEIMGEPGRRTREKTVGLDGDDDDVVTHIYDNDNIFSLYLPQLANKSQLFFV